MELLSPAKNLETAIAAINCGADAVYIGASDFGARKNASNSLSEIEKLVNYAHFYNVKVYVTFNTILYDNELPIAEKMIHDLYNIGVDALIIQDLGILMMDIPPIELHASTQMNNYDIRRIKFFDDLGFKRIVLARELSLEKITQIKKEVKAELECFVHGALCVSFSGQCYLSHKIGSRSANRGECAQACRLKYSLFNSQEKLLLKDSYLLSLKDFAIYDKISNLVNIGVNSFKIEGRLKDSPYVMNVTAYYRKVIDSVLENNSKHLSSGKCFLDFDPDLYKVFNRGFTHYFFDSNTQEKRANFFSPKSIGEYLGVLSEKKGQEIVINTEKQVSNGDGLCYIKNNSLFGFRVEKTIGKKIIANTDKNLQPGDKIFRNLDTAFFKKLSSSKTARKIAVDFSLFVEGDKVFVKICDEDYIEIILEVPFAYQEAQNKEKAFENLKENFSKTGEKFYLRNFYILGCTPFLPNSVVSTIRRQILEILTKKRVEKFKASDSKIPNNDVKYFLEEDNYKLNVSNKLAKKFYQLHGCKVVQPAFELLKNTSSCEVMTTKYCIRQELGFCPKNNKNVPQDWKSQEFFLQNDYGKFLLKFDCKDCVMRIFS